MNFTLLASRIVITIIFLCLGYLTWTQNVDLVKWSKKKLVGLLPIATEGKADAAINTLKSMETPMSPEAFSEAMKLADKHKLFAEYGIEIKLTVEMNDGTILTGISTGAHGHNAKRGYRYYINSETGVTQEFYLADVHVVSHFTISEIK